jgi:hypothetical protein
VTFWQSGSNNEEGIARATDTRSFLVFAVFIAQGAGLLAHDVDRALLTPILLHTLEHPTELRFPVP